MGIYRGFHKWLYSKSVFHGQSHLQMDDDYGYPHFRKPPHGKNMKKCWRCRELYGEKYGKKTTWQISANGHENDLLWWDPGIKAGPSMTTLTFHSCWMTWISQPAMVRCFNLTRRLASMIWFLSNCLYSIYIILCSCPEVEHIWTWSKEITRMVYLLQDAFWILLWRGVLQVVPTGLACPRDGFNNGHMGR